MEKVQFLLKMQILRIIFKIKRIPCVLLRVQTKNRKLVRLTKKRKKEKRNAFFLLLQYFRNILILKLDLLKR